jgi:predicted  nucleic acid-binding Zn-ribbon protein
MPQVVITVAAIGFTVANAVGVSIGFFTALAIGGATIVAAGMLANKIISNLYEMPTMDTDQSRQNTVRSTVEPQKIIYGETLVSGPIAFVGVAGTKNKDLYHAVVLAGHEVNAITDIHFDNQVIPSSAIDGSGNVTSGVFGPKGGETICKINKKLGGAGQTADADLSATFAGVGANHKGTGLAYIVTKWSLIDKSQETWDQYKPQNIKALVQGRKVYDYRLDDELVKPNVNNASFIAYSTNPVWCLIDYLINTDFGMSVNPNRIDWDAAVVAADACDATVSVPGGVEKRFTCNGVLFGTDSHKTNINKLLSSMNGMMSYTNGQFVIRAGVYEAPSVSLNEDSLTGAVSVKTSVERSDRFNTVNGVFIDPSQNYKSTEFPEVFTTAARNRDNDEILTKEIQLPMTNSRFMAQRIANKLVQQSDQQKVVTFPTNLSGMEVAIGDRVSLSLAEFNWSNKVFLCLGWTLSDSGNGGINLILREDDSGSYADPAVGEYSTVSSTGALVEGFRGVPDPSNLSATAGLKSIELNWTNPDNMSEVLFVEIFASPNSSWASRVKVGETNGTQFFHDGSTTADPLDIGDQRYYWVRARAYSTGEDATAVSDRNPDNDTSTITATVGGVDFDDVVGDAKPEDNATVGATVGTDLYDTDGTTVLGGADVLNEVLEQQILNVQIETGEVLDLETGQDVIIQNLGDVAIYVNESNQIINSSIGSLSTAFSNLENTVVDLTSGVSDVYVQATAPVAGVGGIPDPIPTFSRWYDSDDSNEPYYWDGTQWVSLADPRIASNAASIVTLQSGLNTANSNISGNSSAISVLDATTISQGSSIASLSSDVTTLQSDLTTAEGDIVTNASAISGLTTRVTTAEGEITSQASDITTLETTVNDGTTGVAANASAISGLNTRVTANESSITSQATQTTVLNASLADLIYIQDEADSILETETGEELLLNLATNVATATSEIVETLDSRVVATEQGIVSQSQALTALESELGTVDSEQQATATAVSALTTRVTQTETDITINSSDITALESSLTTTNGNITANASAISSLDTRVTSTEGSITANSSDITSLESSLATTDGNVSANATAISSLTTRVVATEDGIVAQAQDITELQAELDTVDGEQQATAGALNSLTVRVSDTESGVSANAQSIQSLSATVDTNSANIVQINDVSVTSTSAIAQAVAGLTATVGNNSANITQINTVSADSGSAVARAVNSLNVTVGEDTVTLQEVKDVTDGVSAQYSVTIDNNGHVSGFGLVSDIIDGNPTSDFTISADTFSIGGTGGLSDVSPFVVYTTEQTIVKDGVSVTVPAGVYIGDAFIQSAAIGGTKIADGAITADKITAGTITADKIVIDGITLDSDESGNLIVKDGGISNAKVLQGTLQADRLVGNVVKSQVLTLGSPVSFIGNAGTSVATFTLPAPDDVSVGHLPVAVINLEWYIQAGANWDDDGGDLPEIRFELYQGASIVARSTYTHPKFNDTVASFEKFSIAIVANGSVTTSSQSFTLIVDTGSFDTPEGGETKGVVSSLAGVILGVR